MLDSPCQPSFIVTVQPLRPTRRHSRKADRTQFETSVHTLEARQWERPLKSRDYLISTQLTSAAAVKTLTNFRIMPRCSLQACKGPRMYDT